MKIDIDNPIMAREVKANQEVLDNAHMSLSTAVILLQGAGEHDADISAVEDARDAALAATMDHREALRQWDKEAYRC